MRMKNREKSTGLRVAVVFSVIFLLGFIGAFVAFAFVATYVNDADIDEGFSAIFNYLFNAFPDLFTFSFHNPNNYLYVALTGGLYFVLAIALIYLIVGIVISAKKRKKIVALGIIAALLAVPVYFIVAAGSPKYVQILRVDPDDTLAKLKIPTFVLVICGLMYIVLSYILYFTTIVLAYKKPIREVKEASISDISEAPVQEEQGLDAVQAEEPVLFESIETETTPENFEPVPEPEPEAEPEPEPEEAKEEAQPKADDKEDLKAMLREIVRDIVRDEIARNNANQSRNELNPLGPVTGATFGGPLVVQYFNGGINSATPTQDQPSQQPAQQPVVQTVVEPAPNKEEPKPEVSEEQVVEPEPEPVAEANEEVTPEVVPEVAPETVEMVIEEPAPEKKPIIRIPFTERMLNADEEMKNNYNELKNEILSYGVNSRVSNSGDTFRLHRKTYIKITIAGLSLKLYFALDPEDYKDSTLPIQNAGHKGIYAEIPLVFKVKSGLSMRRCKQLIQDVFDKNGLEQGEIGTTDWVNELQNSADSGEDND